MDVTARWNPKRPIWRTHKCAKCEHEIMILEGDWIRNRRDAKGYTQEFVAELLGVTKTYVAHLEKNRRKGTERTRAKLVEILK